MYCQPQICNRMVIPEKSLISTLLFHNQNIDIIIICFALSLAFSPSVSSLSWWSFSNKPTMGGSCFNVVPFYQGFLRRAFISSGLSSQTIQIDSETTIHFWGPPSDLAITAMKPSLLLIQGYGPNCLWQWQHQVPFLSSHFNVYVPDLIFFGQSTTNSSERSELFQAVSLRKLVDKLGVERFSVLGTSYGGFVAYHLARMLPERVEKVVIANCAINMRRSDNDYLMAMEKVENIEDLMVPRNTKNLKALIDLCVYKRRRRRHVLSVFFLNDILTTMYIDNWQEKLELFRAITFGQDDTVNISPLQQEVLIVWGKHDQVFRLEKAFELKEILGEKVSLEVLKKTAHLPHVEDPNKFNGIIKRFLCPSS